MNRRGFLQAMLAACAAPAIVRADSLMKIVTPKSDIILPNTADFYNLGDGDWTIECWVKAPISDVRVTRGAARYLAAHVDDQWHHIGVTKKGPFFQEHLDGAPVPTGTLPVMYPDFKVTRQGDRVSIGPDSGNFEGQLDNLRLTTDHVREIQKMSKPEFYSMGASVSNDGVFVFDSAEAQLRRLQSEAARADQSVSDFTAKFLGRFGDTSTKFG